MFYFMLLDWVIYCRGGCWREVSFWALVGSLALWHSMNWILKSSVTAFLFLKPSGQGLPHYRCNNQSEELVFCVASSGLFEEFPADLFARGSLQLGKWVAQPAFLCILECILHVRMPVFAVPYLLLPLLSTLKCCP